jgi:hypothetical protein
MCERAVIRLVEFARRAVECCLQRLTASQHRIEQAERRAACRNAGAVASRRLP